MKIYNFLQLKLRTKKRRNESSFIFFTLFLQKELNPSSGVFCSVSNVCYTVVDV